MKPTFLLAAILCLPALAPAADIPGSNPNVPRTSVNDRLATARKAIQAKDWQLAMNELNTAAREEPRNADVHNLLGYSWRKRATPDMDTWI